MVLAAMLEDVLVAGRGLWRAKSFSAAAILALTLGIAGADVMFTLVQGVLLRPLPVREQDRLIVSWKELRASGFAHYPFGDVEIEAVGRASRLLEMVAGCDANGVGPGVVSEDGTSSYVSIALVTGRFFEVLGVEAIHGRAIAAADGVEGAEPVIVISHGLWQRRYGGARDVIGRRLTISEQRFAIVGVMPPGLDYPTGVEAWRTTHSVSTSGPFGDAARREVDLLARLRSGVTIEQAADEIAALTRRLEPAMPANVPRGLVPVVRSLEAVVVGDVRAPMIGLMIAVGLVLLIASANVANLLMMRGEGRRAELAVREALGAGRARIVRQLLAESLLLALVAGACGLVATWWSLQGLLALLPDGLPRIESVRIDVTVAAFTLAVVFVTTLAAGLAPALSLASADLMSSLRDGGRGVSGPGVWRGRRALVVAQVALAVTVVSAAGLLTRSVLRLQAVDIGVAADRIVFVDLVLPSRYAERVHHAQFLDDAVGRLQAAPAIAAATPVNVMPFSGDGGWDVPRFTAEGQDGDRAASNPSLNLESVHPNYFETFEIPLVRGRAFTPADRERAPEVAIVSEDVAARTWPGDDPIGKRVKMGGTDSTDPWRTVIGIAAATRYRELTRARATIYLPAAQFQMTAQMLAVRTHAPLDLVAAIVREAVRAVDPNVLVTRVAPFAEMLDRPLARPRFDALLLTTFGSGSLLLATIGLYAVMSAYVRQREREIALRVALGATPARVRRLVLGEALSLAGLGAALGVAGAVVATRMVRARLFEVDALEPAVPAAAALLLMAAAALAAYLPARRATRADGVALLRN